MAMTATRSTAGVPWRRVLALVGVVALVIGVLSFVFRADGIPAVDASSSQATRWFVHQPTNRVVLVDGFGGRALASLDAGGGGDRLFTAEGPTQAFLLDDTLGDIRPIDSAELRLGPSQPSAPLGNGTAIARVTAAGLVVADPDNGVAVLIPQGGEPVPLDIPTTSTSVSAGEQAVIAADGSILQVVDDTLVRTSSQGSVASILEAPGDAVTVSAVGADRFLLDRQTTRVRFGDGPWIPIESPAAGDEFVVQQPGPRATCGWVVADDDLWCVGSGGIERSVTIDGLDADGGDLLAIAGDAGALVRRGPTQVVHLDWRTAEILDAQPLTIRPDAVLDVIATLDVIWIDDVAGDFVWSVHPWGIEGVQKNDSDLLVLGEEGEVIDQGEGGSAGQGASDDGQLARDELREPDDNDVDDPPVAIDDQVTARSGAAVQIAVTANDFDPDGEAIAVADVDRADRGTVEVGTATTVVYTPEPGYVGLDTFGYTIVDGDGSEASASVTVELLPPDSNNQPPIGAADVAQTGPGTSVVVEVLLNDIDPERDSLRIAQFSADPAFGEVTEVDGPAGLRSLRYVPAPGFEGRAVFSYRPVDSFDAVGEPVDVVVEVARPDDANRAPIVRPDSVRVRRGTPVEIPVLVNDDDPDGDLLVLELIRPLPDSLDVSVEGDRLVALARPGSPDLIPFAYSVDDGNGHVVRGSVLVAVIDEVEPNRPPVASPDTATTVVGETVLIDVTANDTDPDGDPLALIDVGDTAGRGVAAVASGSQVSFSATAFDDEGGGDGAIARFTYTIADGNGHEVEGEVTVTVLPEALPDPPIAQDDPVSTTVDTPVTIDVLRNDRDPSGERPSLVGSPGCPGGGRATVTADQQVRYDPPLGRDGAYRCNYEVQNSQGLRATASILITVRQPENLNQAPRAVVDTATINPGDSITRDVTQNDLDPDGDAADLRVTSSTQPMIGTATRDGNEITYVADDAIGVVTIGYTIEDPDGGISDGRFQIRIVEPDPVAPIATPDERVIPGPGVSQSFEVLANDLDPDGDRGDLRVVSAARSSGDGTVSLVGSVVLIEPDPEFIGDIVAEYTIVDADDLISSSTVTLTVLEPVNRPPVANDDSAAVANGGSVTVGVLTNDSDPDGDPLTLSITSPPDSALGQASVTGQSIRFSAQPGRSGTAVIGYQVSDGEEVASATLRVEVATCAQSTPQAADGFFRTGYQQPIGIDFGSLAANGQIVDVSGPPGFDGAVYTPPAGENGNVSITYAVVNECRERATGTVTIDVNQDPAAQNQSISMSRGEELSLPVSSLGSDDEPLTIVSSTGEPPWVAVAPGGLTLRPDEAVVDGEYVFSVQVADPGGLNATATISITISNAPPVAVADSVNVADGAVTAKLLANDVDPDGPQSELTVLSLPAEITFENGEVGTVGVLPNGHVRINPESGRGNAVFSYTIIDAGGAVSEPADVTVTGPRLNRAPTASDSSVTISTGVTAPVTLVASDPDGDAVEVIDLVDAGGVVVNGPNGLSIDVRSSTRGIFEVAFRVRDPDGLTSPTATLTVTVEAPVATTSPPTTVAPTTAPPSTTAPTTTTTSAPPTTAPPTTAPPTTAAPTTVPPGPGNGNGAGAGGG